MLRRDVVSTSSGNIKLHSINYDRFDCKKRRTIRVYLPSCYYDSDDTYDVIYMLDGQNLFDEKTASYFMEWQIDKTIESLKDEIKPQIVVGLDCSKDRIDEYLPNWTEKIKGTPFVSKAEVTFSFLIDKVMPFIESHYRVNKGRDHTSFGGSSMGGLMAIEAMLTHNDLFKNYYAFSPAFSVFRYGLKEDKNDEIDNGDFVLDSILKRIKKLPVNQKLILTSGGQGYEASYYIVVKKMKRSLSKKYGDNLLVMQDKKLSHNEHQWARFFVDAYKFVNEK